MSDFRSRCCLVAFMSGLLACLLTTGCSNSVENQVAAMNDSHIKQVANLYYAYRGGHGGAPPSSEDALKKFAKDMSPHKLELMHIDSNKLDDIFTSERDGKPFKIKPNVGLQDTSPVAFEAEGRGGMREVGFIGPSVKIVDSAEYQKLWSDQKSDKSPTGDSKK